MIRGDYRLFRGINLGVQARLSSRIRRSSSSGATVAKSSAHYDLVIIGKFTDRSTRRK